MDSNDLDLTSSTFDPTAILKASNINLPCPNAKIYSNICEFETYVLKGRRTLRQETKKDNPEEDKPEPNIVSEKRVDQLPAPSTSKLERIDVLTRMKSSFTKGPLSLLNKCVQLRTRVKVYIRNYGDIRGTCIGFIMAFDKHWNLAMRDVDEEYVKRKKVKTPILKILPLQHCRTITRRESSKVTTLVESDSDSFAGSVENIPDTSNISSLENSSTENVEVISGKKTESSELSTTETSKLLQESVTRLNIEDKTDEKDNNKIDETLTISTKAGDLKSENISDDSASKVIEKRRRKKKPEICKRHVNQIFIRGDNVVLINLL